MAQDPQELRDDIDRTREGIEALQEEGQGQYQGSTEDPRHESRGRIQHIIQHIQDTAQG